MVRICFVCLGNICRSPTAEGVFNHHAAERKLTLQLRVDSAGTGGWHEGELADPRARKAAEGRGVALESRARKFLADDFDRFDYILVMDRSNRDALEQLAPDETARAKVALFLSFDPESPADAEVPDPYYGGEQGFEHVLDLCERASLGLLTHLEKSGELKRAP
ncbi:MAG: low molecular weight protein-tyrosine-phosphatase [Myxococcota bacterium]